ncbi:CIA30 family protein [Robiginitalea aurantiaca]|uniref:CIA30 family protein n=1 Tax=Robiginitalea aurantiaca TaxID=3056915 RepID=A0ABT7WF66_9FLAO|nr:CIA30 family protein [Robiginitalea aurantiaca]MDM9631559.1 CIA30 family protein [Robiginitalea aurantiaca]
MTSKPIFNFQSGVPLSSWYVVNDGVMGGRSQGNLLVDQKGYGVFSGRISLENNGGFSSIRYDCGPTDLKGYRYLVLRIKGDGKRYQFRIKANKQDYYSYVSYFDTSGEWQDVKLPLNTMYAVFRGSRLNLPDFAASSLEEIGILIGNKKAEEFELLIDEIRLEQ